MTATPIQDRGVQAVLDSAHSGDGDGAAVATVDNDNVLSAAYHPAGLTVLLVFSDAKAQVVRGLSRSFELTPTLRELRMASTSLSASQAAVS